MQKTKKENSVPLTLDEKISLTTGVGNWNTAEIKEKGIVSVRMQDGSNGLRFQEGDGNDINGAGESTVCFPTEASCAASFDRSLVKEMGEELGRECRAKDVNLLLGPGINIKRSPLCGRNFEYYSEDPYVSGELGAAFVEGIQSQGVGACVKHFFANNQEYRRMNSSSNLDERTEREIYLAAFEKVVKKAKPWAVMAAYNKVNGTYCTENKRYLSEILREEWGYDGVVISDWGATHDRAAAVEAGCDLTMPQADDHDAVLKAVEEGKLSSKALEQVASRLSDLAANAVKNIEMKAEFDYEAGHALAKKIAAESMVLLKNERNVLPLKKEETVAFIGRFAKEPRYQGSGSSKIASYRVESAVDAAEMSGLSIRYAKGYEGDACDEQLLAEAVKLAKETDTAVLFVGLSESMESEGYDRSNMSLPQSHLTLIEKVTNVAKKVVVVLHNGAPVEMPWIDEVDGVLETYLAGEAVGSATVDILYGKSNPSGRLPETFPMKVQDYPAYLFYGGENGQVDYNEKMFVGYRYYTSTDRAVRFPFGFGLSYTTFDYEDMKLTADRLSEETKVTVNVDISNSGTRGGKEVVQLYISPCEGEYKRPVIELKRFEKIQLEPGEKKQIAFELSYRDFACYSPKKKDWYAKPGTYKIYVGKSANDLLLMKEIQVEGQELLLADTFDESTMLRQFVLHPVGKEFFDTHYEAMLRGMSAAGLVPEEMIEAVLAAGSQAGMDGLLDQATSILLDFSGVSKEEREALFQSMNE